MASSREELERMKDLFLKRESKKSYNKHDLEYSFVSHLSPAVPYSTLALGFLRDTSTISTFFWMVFWTPSSIK